jgi:hypothetical protein
VTGVRPPVRVGDVLQLAPGDYRYGVDRVEYGTSALRLRVQYAPRSPEILAGEWIPVLGVEVRPNGTDGRARAVHVRRAALPASRDDTGAGGTDATSASRARSGGLGEAGQQAGGERGEPEQTDDDHGLR